MVSSSETTHTIQFGRVEPVEFPSEPMDLIEGSCGINDHFSYNMSI